MLFFSIYLSFNAVWSEIYAIPVTCHYSEMHPLIGKTFLRFVLLHIYGLTVAWIFTLVEKRDEPAQVRMDRILGELRNEINLKYNMTDDDFGNFVKITAEAVTAGNELDWTFVNSWEFVSVAFTTIGKV